VALYFDGTETEFTPSPSAPPAGNAQGQETTQRVNSR
jgi:hypothetical protein